MNRILLPVLGIVVLISALFSPAVAQQKCDGSVMATGPFTYTATPVTEASFTGGSGDPVITGLQITTPARRQQTALPVVFPGDGRAPCPRTAPAWIGPLEVYQVADADGEAITPMRNVTATDLGYAIAKAVVVDPTSHTYEIGGQVAVTVRIYAPSISEAEYGDYAVKVASKADG